MGAFKSTLNLLPGAITRLPAMDKVPTETPSANPGETVPLVVSVLPIPAPAVIVPEPPSMEVAVKLCEPAAKFTVAPAAVLKLPVSV